jgi:hypothetical protein
MTRVLVVWEDAHCEALGALIRRAVRTRSAPDAVAGPAVVCHTSRGNGTFARYVRDTWPLARVRGVPLDPHPIDHMICVVDADRLHELKGVVTAPPDATATDAWHAEVERAWQGWLRSQCDPDGPPVTTVHGLVLRWAKESVLLAGFDQPAWVRFLEVDTSALAVQTELRRQCTPYPSEVPDVSFTSTFRRPLSCLHLVRQACRLSRLDKNDVAIDDALYALARESLPTVLARVPDLGRLTSLIWSLHQGGPEPETVQGAAHLREPTKKAPRATGAAPKRRKRS